MSNIGKKTIELKDQVTVNISDSKAQITGPKGILEMTIPSGIAVEVKDGNVTIKKLRDEKELAKFYGLTRSLISNMVQGVTSGFE